MFKNAINHHFKGSKDGLIWYQNMVSEYKVLSSKSSNAMSSLINIDGCLSGLVLIPSSRVKWDVKYMKKK